MFIARVLLLTPDYVHARGNIYNDLVAKFAEHGHSVTVISPKERRFPAEPVRRDYGNVRLREFRCLNFRGKVSVVEKGISTLLLGAQFKAAWKKNMADERYDIVLYVTPPVTIGSMVQYLKKRCGAFCYLLLEDYFPQNAVDLEMMRKGSLLYRMFRAFERRLLGVADKIGVLSPKCIDFLAADDPWLPRERVECCPNCMIPTDEAELAELRRHRSEVRQQFGIPEDAVLFMYSGTISRAQGIDFVKKMLACVAQENIPNAYFLMVGRGNEYEGLRRFIKELHTERIQITEYIPKEEYTQVLAAADVGMVFLDARFTIANIPSRTLPHLDMSQPIFAATDTYTDYRQMVEDNGIGLWCRSGDLEAALANIRRLAGDEAFRRECGARARRLLLEQLTENVAYETIMKSYQAYMDAKG